MYAALQEAEKAFEEDEVPVGAVVVHNNRIIGKGFNQTRKLLDPTAHAEMIAITSACNTLHSERLEECQIYVTLEPCIMCIGAILHARLESLFFSTFDRKFGACGSLYNIAEENKANHKIKVYHGICENESAELLKNFFTNLKSEK